MCSDYQDREFDDVSPDFLTYHTSGATLGHIPFHLEVHGSSRTCAIITYWMLIEMGRDGHGLVRKTQRGEEEKRKRKRGRSVEEAFFLEAEDKEQRNRRRS